MSEKTKLKTINLSGELQVGGKPLTEVNLRAPKSGELRGLSLLELGRISTDEVLKLIPRITMPPLTDEQASELSASELMEIGMEISNFLVAPQLKTGSPKK